ncbi:MAG: class V aminotransferase [Candidatus Firestonebacteria bacterium RIFOXYC2_FULL_39_67]|nr:MAG: class V aminotransferase [Candidatus Firestonebacteria bacterium RIFOXYD2_FULL_39_29]OGF57056.1 MAG: class V aminotransferase [Candidatus Firestonebacteria bacterium RIFOXYC2_FULL_39_67]
MKKRYIMSPGPVEVPPSVLSVGGLPMIHHRTPEYRKALSEVNEGLKYVFQTKNDILIFPSAGTGGMESAVINMCSPGDKVLVAACGQFGERWAKIAESFGIIPVKVFAEWGNEVDYAKVEAELKTNPDIKAVFTTLSETSTGIENDIKKLGGIVKGTKAVFVVDAVSGMGAVEFKTDEWSVDVTVVGAQKGMMIPPGVAMVSLSEKAKAAMALSKTPKYYFSYEQALKALTKDKLPDTPYTSSVSLVLQLRESIRLIKEEGLESVWARHSKIASAVRAGVKALGLKPFAKGKPSNSVTSIWAPEGIDGDAVNKKIRDDYGITMAGGQGKMKGKMFRIGHLGYVDRFDAVIGISAVEMALTELGIKVELGKGVKAVEEELLKK